MAIPPRNRPANIPTSVRLSVGPTILVTSRHLANLDGINPTHLRRTAALHLCQMAVGGSIRQAVQRLGLPDTTATNQRQDPHEFGRPWASGASMSTPGRIWWPSFPNHHGRTVGL
jgi:hypothetical protein